MRFEFRPATTSKFFDLHEFSGITADYLAPEWTTRGLSELAFDAPGQARGLRSGTWKLAAAGR